MRATMFALCALLAGCAPLAGPEGEAAPPRMLGPAPGVPAAAQQLLQDARAAEAAGDAAQAHRLLERAQRIAPSSPEVYVALAQFQQRRGQCPQAAGLAARGQALPGLRRAQARALAEVAAACRR